MTTGAALKQAREDAELTQEQVAEKLGVSRVTVTLWEGKAEGKKPKDARFPKGAAEARQAEPLDAGGCREHRLAQWPLREPEWVRRAKERQLPAKSWDRAA